MKMLVKQAKNLKAITSFQFIASLSITRSVFDLTLPVTQLLQSKSLDIYNGISMITALRNSLQSIKHSINLYHAKWYQIALDLAESVNVNEAKSRTCGKQMYRSNNVLPNSTTSDYRVNVTLPLLDYLIMELSNRFDQTSMISYFGLSIIPENMLFIKNH